MNKSGRIAVMATLAVFTACSPAVVAQLACGLSPSDSIGGAAQKFVPVAGDRLVISRGITLELLDVRDASNPVILDRTPATLAPNVWGLFDQLVVSGDDVHRGSIVCAVQRGWAHLFETSAGHLVHTGSRQLTKVDGSVVAVQGAMFDGAILMLAGPGALETLDVSDPTNPVSMTRRAAIWTSATGSDGENGVLFTPSDNAIRITNTRTGQLTTFIPPYQQCYAPVIDRGRMFLRRSDSEVWGYDLSNLGGIRLTTVLSVSGPCDPQIAMDGNIGFHNISGVLTATDLSRQLDPVILGQLASLRNATAFVVIRPGLLACRSDTRLVLVDVSDPANMRIVGQDPSPWPRIVEIAGGGSIVWAIVGADRLIAFEHAEGRLVPISSLQFPAEERLAELELDGTTLAVANTRARLRLFDVSNPHAPRARGSIDLNDFSYEPGAIAIKDGLCALPRRAGNIDLIDVSNVDAPIVRSTINVNGSRGISIGNGRLVVVGPPLKIFNIENPGQPTLVPLGPPLQSMFAPDAVAIHDGVLAVAPVSQLHLFDLAAVSGPNSLLRSFSTLRAMIDLSFADGKLAGPGPVVFNVEDPQHAYIEAPASAEMSESVQMTRVALLDGAVARVDIESGLAVFPLDVAAPPAVRRGLPAQEQACLNHPFEMTVEIVSRVPVTYAWYKNDVLIPDAREATLRIPSIRITDTGRYRCVISNACGSVTEPSVAPYWFLLSVCTADFNCDRFVDFFDYADFIVAFESGDPGADLNGDDFLDFFDYERFVDRFGRGC